MTLAGHSGRVSVGGSFYRGFYRGSYRGHLKFNIDVILVSIKKTTMVEKLPSNETDLQRSNKAH